MRSLSIKFMLVLVARLLLGTCVLVACFPSQAQEVIRYVHTDALGSPIAESDETGSIAVRYSYEPFGEAVGNAPHDAPAYTGHVADASTGMINMQQRYYDPSIERFLSVDPVTAHASPIVAFNRYRYANSNPYGFTDPDGRSACGQDTTCRLKQGASGSTIQVNPAGQQLRETNRYVDPGPGGTEQMSREFELAEPSPRGGHVVQEMTIKFSLTSPKKKSESLTYYEAFQVPAGATSPFPAKDTFVVTPPPGTSGTVTWRGSARFYEGLKLPSSFGQFNVRHAGSLPSTTINPRLDTSGATAPVIVEFETSWP